jgi:putative MATE family efflux protein
MTVSVLEPSFTRKFLRLFLPAATQSLFFNLIGIFDVLMVGQLGDVPVAAVGLSGQLAFLLNLTLFGATGGAAVYMAQYWGAGDRANLRRVLGMTMGLCLATAALFAFFALVFSRQVLSLYTDDPQVITAGASILRIVGWSYIFSAVTTTFYAGVRSTGNTRLPMIIGVTFLCLTTLTNYVLIFGKLGLPAMGVRGIATGRAICTIAECLVLLGILYRLHSPVAAPPAEFFRFNLAFVRAHLQRIFLVLANEFVWALGVNINSAILARLGTSAYAGYNIATTIIGSGFFMTMGCATSASIMVGHAIGAGRQEEAYQMARRILLVNLVGSFVIGMVLVALRGWVVTLYQVEEATRQAAAAIILVGGLFFWLRSQDGMFVVGILRGGGDIRFGALLDVGGLWLAAIPAVAITVLIFHMPIHWVYAGMLLENLVKAVGGLIRFRSRKWIKNIMVKEAGRELGI